MDKKSMNILVACEESQVVTLEFRKRGFNAFSCDLMECSGGHPEYHIQGDVRKYLGKTKYNSHKGWDMILAFPPCTHLAVSGARWFEKKREDGRQRKAIEFFMEFLTADCPRIAVENPVGIISGEYIKEYFPDLCEEYGLPIKSDQMIQPYGFGDPYEKRTCLWLRGLPKLKPTNVVEPEPRVEYDSGKTMPGWCAELWSKSEEERSKLRSRTFPGIAEAMADQWGNV